MLKKLFTAQLVLLLLLLAPLVQAAPKIEHWTTANGLRVYYVHAPDLPIVDLNLIFDAGSARDGDKPGLAMLTSGMLNKGADGLSEDQLAPNSSMRLGSLCVGFLDGYGVGGLAYHYAGKGAEDGA